MKKGGAIALAVVLALSLFVVLFVTTGVREEVPTDCVPGRGISSAAGGVPAGSFAKPMKTSEAQLTSPFGSRWGTMHKGIDLAGPVGTPIYAYADGIVAQAGPAAGFGMWIVLEHNIDGQTVSTVYGHMFPDGVLVKPGEHVTAGQHIADEGNNGDTTGAHLHFEYHTGPWSPDNAIDPQPFYEAAAEPGSGQTGQSPLPPPSTTAPTTPAPSGAGGTTEMAALPGSVGSEEHFQVDTVRVARAVYALSGLAAVFAGGMAFGHYLIVLYAALALALALPVRAGARFVPSPTWRRILTIGGAVLAVAALALGAALGRVVPTSPSTLGAALSPESRVVDPELADACPPGSSAVVWGWSPELYVHYGWNNGIPMFTSLGTATDPATRERVGRYLERALDDVDCVVDAVGPPYFVGPESAIPALYPALTPILDSEFIVLPALDCASCTVYVRRDRSSVSSSRDAGRRNEKYRWPT